MKIVSYNINKCTQAKIDHVFAKDADLYVLPECGDQSHIILPEGYDMLWCGDDDLRDKGLAVIWKKHLSVHIPEEYKKIKHIMPLCVNGDGFPKFILASWPTIWKEDKTYPQLFLEALRQYRFYLDRFPALAIGDFNYFVGQKLKRKSTGTFEQCIDIFKAHRMRSLYHEQTGEEFGKETKPTYHHLFKESMPFHIDYAFTNLPVKHFVVGEWEKQISDHCPLVLEFKTADYDGQP